MPKRLIITKVCFHVLAALCALLAVAAVIVALHYGRSAGELSNAVHDPKSLGKLFGGMEMGNPVGMFDLGIGILRATIILTLSVMLVFAVGLELLVRGLGRGEYWAWIAGLVVSGLLILGGATIIPGGLSLWGLLDRATVAAFKPVPRGVAAEAAGSETL
jgi:hypothetical protein